ncbi:MAG: hypothetical protein MAGBODY4_00245 [Candidatus Marinimicrobia bacterium]|nr:hypothetical protein [Candidatus Neomarinimicrobiota bacterium]
MNYLCLYTIDDDLAESFRIFYEGKYVVLRIEEKSELYKHLRSEECQCQLLIFDPGNPTMKDFQYLEEIKHIRPDIKIIVSYVYFEEKNFSEEFLASHVDAILYKPFDFGEVDRRIQKLLHPAQQDESIPA